MPVHLGGDSLGLLQSVSRPLTSLSTPNCIMFSIDGLVTGIDTQKVLDGLLQIQQKRIDQLTLQKQHVSAQQAAFQTIEASVVSLRSSLSRLSRSQNGVFTKQLVSVSDDSILSATAQNSATAGVYQVSVESVAAAHQVASQSLSSADAAITQGTFSIRSGDGPVTDIVVDDSNDTLQGLADAIAASATDISAAIIQDGSGYRLLLTAKESGTDHTLQITNNLGADTASATQVVIDVGNPVQEAANSVVKLGQGAGAISATAQGTQVGNLLPGLTLDILKAAPGEIVTVQVKPDSESAVAAVGEFVSAYNNFVKGIAQQTRYVPETDAAGILLGENSVIDIQSAIQSALQEAVPGVDRRLNRLTAIGVSFNDDGTLTLNESRLRDVLEGRVSGLSATNAQRLFSLSGNSNHPGISFLLGSSRTKASATPYEVDISRAAKHAELSGNTPLAVSTLIDDTNDSLNLTVDGQEIDIVLQHGTYTASELATKLADTINANPDLLGRRVTTGVNDDGTLSLQSDSYGRTSELVINSGSLITPLGLTAAQGDTGVDVAGQFIVNGIPEPASGSGRVLTGLSTNEHTADLQVRVTLNSADITFDSEAELQITQGIASRLDNLLGGFLDVDNGRLGIVNRGFTARAEALQASIDRQNALFQSQSDRITRQMAALESAISQIQGTSSLLGAQLAALSGSKSK